MKKLIYILFLATLLVSCEDYFYDDYTNDFEYTAVYFPHQTLERSFVYDEFDQIQLAVQMGGRRENTANEWADFEIDASIPVDSSLTLLPESFYSLSNEDRFEILPGDMGGEITLTVGEDFFNAADTIIYYLPFSLSSTSLDTILESKTTMVLILNLETAGFGHYYHNGVMQVDSTNGTSSITAYHQEEPVSNEVNNWELSSYSMDTLLTNGIANQKSGAIEYNFKLSIRSDNSVGIAAGNTSVWKVEENGASVYDQDKKEFYLNYKYMDADGNNYTVSDTLIFRNRILDGVNQWK
jgi:hypothetical protein